MSILSRANPFVGCDNAIRRVRLLPLLGSFTRLEQLPSIDNRIIISIVIIIIIISSVLC